MSVDLLGIEINNYTFEESINRGLELISQNCVSQVVTINPEMFTTAEKDSEFKKILDSAEIVIPDGVGVKLGLKLKGYNVQRIPGIDFAFAMLVKSAENGYPVAIVGSKQEVIDKAVENLKNRVPNLNIVYYHNGYFDNNEIIYNELKNSGAKLILVALGSPKQEFFIYNAKNILQPCLMIGVGGSLDVWSGYVKRAPEIYQKLGLEWLYRTLSQPERFKRIFPALPLFLLKILMYKKDNKNVSK